MCLIKHFAVNFSYFRRFYKNIKSKFRFVNKKKRTREFYYQQNFLLNFLIVFRKYIHRDKKNNN